MECTALTPLARSSQKQQPARAVGRSKAAGLDRRSASCPPAATCAVGGQRDESPPFTPPWMMGGNAVQVSERTCQIAPSIGEWAALQNGRHDKLLRRRLTRHVTTKRQNMQLNLETGKVPTRRRRQTRRAEGRAPAPRVGSADDAASLGCAPVLPPLSFADTMRFGHDLSVALGTVNAGQKSSVSFEEAVELDAAAVESAEGDMLVDLLCSAVVSSAIDDAMGDICGVVGAVMPPQSDILSTAVKPAVTLHVNSTLGTALGAQGQQQRHVAHGSSGAARDAPQPLGKLLFPHTGTA